MIPKVVVSLAVVLIHAALHYWHALRGYPRSLLWNAGLFVTGVISAFLVFVFFPSLLTSGSEMDREAMLIAALISILFGFSSTFLLPFKLRRVI